MDPAPFDHTEEDSVSPLRSFCSPTIPPTPPALRHTAVTNQDFERLTSNALKTATSKSSEHSQSRRFAPSPLDTIPSSLYPRFPRFSTTMENSTPDLSAEEMTSTRLSIDEHDIMQTPQSIATSSEANGKRRKLNTALHKAISTPSLSLRQVRDRLRRALSSTLSGNTLRQEATSTLEQQSQCSADQVSGTDVNSASCSTHRSPDSSLKQENGVLRFKRSSKELLTRTSSRWSTLTERKVKNELPIYQNQDRALLDEPAKRFQPLSFGALRAFDDFMDSSVTSFNSYYTAPDQNLPRSTSSGRNRPGSILPGSLDELRSNSFVTASQRAFSFSGVPPGRLSQVNLDQTPRLTPVARPVTLHDAEDVGSLNQLRQDPLFVDMPNGPQTNFIFPPSTENSAPVVPHSLRSSSTRSYRNLRQSPTLPLLLRSTNMKQGLERRNHEQKVPRYTPLQIVRRKGPAPFFPRQVSSLAEADPALQSWDSMKDEMSAASDQSSTKRLSKASEWSTKEDRTDCQDPDHPSIRSEDPSVKSGDFGPWWKGEKFLAVFKKLVPRRAGSATINGSEVACESETEKEDCKEPFKRTCGFYARRMKQKLSGTHLHDATEKD